MCLGNVDAKSYVLVSKLEPEVYSKYVEDKQAAHVSGFAFVVISIVHLAGGKISEGKGTWLVEFVRKTPRFDVSGLCHSNFRGPLASIETARLK